MRLVPLVLAVLAAAGFLALTGAGRTGRPVEPVVRLIDRFVAEAGFAIEEVRITGLENADAAKIHGLVGAAGAETLVGIDIGALRRAIVANEPWVRAAAITRIWPDRLQIALDERQAFAVHHVSAGVGGGGARGQGADGLAGRYAFLVDRAGTRLAEATAEAHAALPQLLGPGAATAGADLFDKLAEWPVLEADVVAAERIGRRRWTLHLNGGRHVHLPASGVAGALDRLMTVYETGAPAGVSVIDLRVPGRIYLGAHRHGLATGAGPLSADQVRGGRGRGAGQRG